MLMRRRWRRLASITFALQTLRKERETICTTIYILQQNLTHKQTESADSMAKDFLINLQKSHIQSAIAHNATFGMRRWKKNEKNIIVNNSK